MSDTVVTVPMGQWAAWLAEGDLPGEDAQYESHFWIPRPLPKIEPGERVYIVAHGKLRGYAPLVRTEQRCSLNPGRACLVRESGAVAVTTAEPIRGFQGWRYVWWNRGEERPFPDWMNPHGQPEAGSGPSYIMICTGCNARLDPTNPRSLCACAVEVRP